ncbi:MAG: Fic family protein [Bacteroidota bacterium]
MRWIYEHAEWPEFRWDPEEIMQPLAQARYQQGLLIGQMNQLGWASRQDAYLQTLEQDAIQSARIEGEMLQADEVRSSLVKKLGINQGGYVKASRDVEGMVEMLLDATRLSHVPLSKVRLVAWHAGLFPTGYSGIHPITIGDWRQEGKEPMQVVSGAWGKEVVHFQAPSAARVEKEMDRFLAWYNQPPTTDLILQAAIAHFWFVTIHPFDDGNGRIARAIGEMTLARSDQSIMRFYSMSGQIEKNRNEYYQILEQQQKADLDLTPWLLWFLECLSQSFQHAEQTLAKIIYRARFWEFANKTSLNPRQRMVLTRMLGDFEGYMNTGKYARMTKVSKDTALRDIKDLLSKHIFKENTSKGRSTSYRLTKGDEITPPNL